MVFIVDDFVTRGTGVRIYRDREWLEVVVRL